MSTEPTRNRRILIVDDNEDIHRDFRQVLSSGAKSAALSLLDELESSILGEAPATPTEPLFELSSAFQGAEALARVQQAQKAGAPYAVAFVDMRMPPGWDGLETLTRLWQEDPCLQAVICSAYSDHSWESLRARFGQTDRLLILKKPFDPVEVRQMAWALTEKWNQSASSQRTQQAMRRSEMTLHALLRMLPDALLRVDADGTCLDFQAPQHGTPSSWPSLPAGRNLNELVPEDAAQRMRATIQQALRDGTRHVLEHEQAVGGELRCFESHIAAIDAAEALVLLRDITPRKRAEPSSVSRGIS